MVPRKVLIAEDEEDIVDMVRCVLVARGFEVRSTDNGARAFEMLKEERPDLLVTDILMPGMTGLELCRRIREDENLNDLPVIVITSITKDSDLADGFWKIATDSDDFITKPFSPFELADRIQKIIRGNKNPEEDTTT